MIIGVCGDCHKWNTAVSHLLAVCDAVVDSSNYEQKLRGHDDVGGLNIPQRLGGIVSRRM